MFNYYWCTRKLWSSSTMLYNNNTIAHNHHTNNVMSLYIPTSTMKVDLESVFEWDWDGCGVGPALDEDIEAQRKEAQKEKEREKKKRARQRKQEEKEREKGAVGDAKLALELQMQVCLGLGGYYSILHAVGILFMWSGALDISGVSSVISYRITSIAHNHYTITNLFKHKHPSIYLCAGAGGCKRTGRGSCRLVWALSEVAVQDEELRPARRQQVLQRGMRR